MFDFSVIVFHTQIFEFILIQHHNFIIQETHDEIGTHIGMGRSSSKSFFFDNFNICASSEVGANVDNVTEEQLQDKMENATDVDNDEVSCFFCFCFTMPSFNVYKHLTMI